jgi:hypothetical protein
MYYRASGTIPAGKGDALAKVDNAAFSHPHDLLVRSMLTDVDLAADLLRNYLDPKLTALLDLDRIVLESSVAVDENLAETLGDLRYSLPFKGSGGRLRVFVFLEHQSTPDRFMIFRLLEYMCKAYRQQLSADAASGKRKTFPYPLAVVLHQGKRPWGKVPAMRELIDMVPGVDMDILRLPVFLIDLPRIAPEGLKGNPAVCALLDSLQSASSGRLGERYEEIATRLAAVSDDSRARSWLRTLTKYAMSLCRLPDGLATVRRVLDKIYSKKEAEEMALTLAEELRLEGEARGEARGKAIGKAIGKAEAIVSVLTARFGKVPAALEKKIHGIQEYSSIEQLTFLAATCDSLEAFKKGL